MRTRALDVIHDEHRALAGMLSALRYLVRDIRDKGHEPDFEVLRAILYYIHAFPERLHHPKESELLFKALRRRSNEAAATLDRLDAEHARGEDTVARLVMQLLEYEQLGASRMPAFVQAVERFIDHYLQHMDTEEREILPLAARVLTPEDWEHVDAAFAENKDPLTGHTPSEEFRGLFSRIVNLAPAPIGLGRGRS
jgi:hemerythrin-like domain-containing protein